MSIKDNMAALKREQDIKMAPSPIMAENEKWLTSQIADEFSDGFYIDAMDRVLTRIGIAYVFHIKDTKIFGFAPGVLRGFLDEYFKFIEDGKATGELTNEAFKRYQDELKTSPQKLKFILRESANHNEYYDFTLL